MFVIIIWLGFLKDLKKDLSFVIANFIAEWTDFLNWSQLILLFSIYISTLDWSS